MALALRDTEAEAQSLGEAERHPDVEGEAVPEGLTVVVREAEVLSVALALPEEAKDAVPHTDTVGDPVLMLPAVGDTEAQPLPVRETDSEELTEGEGVGVRLAEALRVVEVHWVVEGVTLLQKDTARVVTGVRVTVTVAVPQPLGRGERDREGLPLTDPLTEEVGVAVP